MRLNLKERAQCIKPESYPISDYGLPKAELLRE